MQKPPSVGGQIEFAEDGRGVAGVAAGGIKGIIDILSLCSQRYQAVCYRARIGRCHKLSGEDKRSVTRGKRRWCFWCRIRRLACCG